jgi:hypothetical protein
MCGFTQAGMLSARKVSLNSALADPEDCVDLPLFGRDEVEACCCSFSSASVDT